MPDFYIKRAELERLKDKAEEGFIIAIQTGKKDKSYQYCSKILSDIQNLICFPSMKSQGHDVLVNGDALNTMIRYCREGTTYRDARKQSGSCAFELNYVRGEINKILKDQPPESSSSDFTNTYFA